MKRLGISILIPLILIGCKVGPDYERPPVDTPAVHRSEPLNALSPGSLANLPWWELFRDEQLQNLIEAALDENKDLRLAAARVDEARAQLGVSRSALGPQVGGTASARQERISGVQFPGAEGSDLEVTAYTTNIDVSYEVDVWGRLRRGTEAAQAELLATEEARRAVVMGLVSKVAQAYFELRALDLELEIAKRTLQSREESFKLVSLRHEAGIASDLDLRRAEGEMSTTAAVIPNLERQIGLKENALRILLGRNPGSIKRGNSLSDQTFPMDVPDGLPSDLLEQRPDIRQAEQALVAANANIGVAKAAYFPRIILTGSRGQQSSDLNNLFVGPNRTWGFGPAVSVPIFDAGKRRSNLEATEARQQQALIQYEQAIQQAFREVDDALIGQTKTKEIRIHQENRITATKESLRLAQLRYDKGFSEYLDVLDAQRQLFRAEIELVTTQQDQLVALVQLYKALGGGWDEQQGPESSPIQGRFFSPAEGERTKFSQRWDRNIPVSFLHTIQ
ncbi:MAG: efflux transporter outer membrane subunit [Nitrospirota bacterium]|nr:MAG: efflux transporter outer membrane subunit [Nitrospirota bacterium]